jgi:hypothetical protein
VGEEERGLAEGAASQCALARVRLPKQSCVMLRPARALPVFRKLKGLLYLCLLEQIADCHSAIPACILSAFAFIYIVQTLQQCRCID